MSLSGHLIEFNGLQQHKSPKMLGFGEFDCKKNKALAWCEMICQLDAGGPGAWKVFCLGGETKKLTLRRKWLGKLPGNWRPNLLWELLRNFGSDFGSYFGTLEVTLGVTSELWKLLWKFGSYFGSLEVTWVRLEVTWPSNFEKWKCSSCDYSSVGWNHFFGT